MEEKKEIKQVKSYALRPSQIAWLRQCAKQESTAEKDVSASAILERIIDDAMQNVPDQSSPTKEKKHTKTLEAIAA